MHTRFSKHFGLNTPIALAPMALASGGALAAACARAGALGLLGGGYGELSWLQTQHALAMSLLRGDSSALQRLGCGFITWKLDEDASALDWLLDQPHTPAALMLSFGDPRPYAARIAKRGVPLICQIQRLEQLPVCLEAGAAVIVAQGAEAGGHGMHSLQARATFSLVPELADALAQHSPSAMLLAAGGIADGRGLAAARPRGLAGTSRGRGGLLGLYHNRLAVFLALGLALPQHLASRAVDEFFGFVGFLALQHFPLENFVRKRVPNLLNGNTHIGRQPLEFPPDRMQH